MTFNPRVGAVPVSKVEIRIQCNKLLDKDVTSKSDPCAVIMMQDKGRWYEFGRTENIKNCLNPQFTTSFEVDYYFEEVQNLRFAVYDIDNKTPQLNDDDFLGAMECTLGQVVSGSPYKKNLLGKNGKQAGQGVIIVTAEEVEGVNDVFNLTFKAQHLDKKDFLGKSDPYLEFSRQAPDQTWQVVYRTEVIKNNLNPQWKPFKVKAQKLCGADMNREIRGECYDFDNDGESDLIGCFTFNIAQCRQAVDQQVEWPCINPKKKAKKKDYKNSGVVILTSCQITKEYSFLDFVFGGLQINFTVGIDFTASNGDPRNPQSLHYINPYQPNEYITALQAVGAVIQDYDSDQMFPALGFGAKVPPTYEVLHEFALNFNPSNPFCAGVQGIVAAYKACISQVQLYGPTNFSPIIYHVAQFARAALQENAAKSYFVLLIITDGVISDMDKTLEAIVYSSGLPMSIIIVGVGNADFTAMDILDGDEGVLRARNGQAACRDIVQFVPFNQFKSAPPAELAKHVLAEIPSQVTTYFRMRGLPPMPRPTGAAGGAAASSGAAPVHPPTQ